MGKRGVIVFLVIAMALVLGARSFTEKPNQLAEVSQVTGCTVDGYCGGDSDGKKTFTVIISSSIDSKINRMYMQNEKEFLLCLFGQKAGNKYYVNGFSEPSYVESFEGRAVYSFCSNTSIATIHNHFNPDDDEEMCQLSARDIYTFGQGGEDLMGIICGINRYVFIHKSDLRPTGVIVA